MPKKARRMCRKPGCGTIVATGYCEEHQPKDTRESAAKRGYGRTWRKLRRMKIIRQPFCEDPEGLHDGVLVMATDVDHIIPKSQGGKDIMSNLQSLCKSCHSKKTAQESSGW